MKPSPVLCARLRFTTKEVGRGFYRGTGTGSTGAHTEYGGYLIDWRKVRNYNVPDLNNFKLTPFVTKEMEPQTRLTETEDGKSYNPDFIDPSRYLQTWKIYNPAEYHAVVQLKKEQQEQQASLEARKKRDQEMDLQHAEKQLAARKRDQEERKRDQERRKEDQEMNPPQVQEIPSLAKRKLPLSSVKAKGMVREQSKKRSRRESPRQSPRDLASHV